MQIDEVHIKLIHGLEYSGRRLVTDPDMDKMQGDILGERFLLLLC
jgi:hypothetical protein